MQRLGRTSFLYELLFTFNNAEMDTTLRNKVTDFLKFDEEITFENLDKKIDELDKKFELLYHNIRKHIILNKLILVSIWDNVNSCYNDTGKLIDEVKNSPAKYHLTGFNCANEILICCASFNNNAIDPSFSKSLWQHLQLDPLKGEDELEALIGSLQPFKDLFEKLKPEDQGAIISKIRFLMSAIPLDISKINLLLKTALEETASPLPLTVTEQEANNRFEAAFNKYNIEASDEISNEISKFRNRLKEQDKKLYDEYIIYMKAKAIVSKEFIDKEW
jgi:hypothetical protein